MGYPNADVPGWTETGDVVASYIEYKNARTAYGKLSHWTNTGAYKVTTSQKVSPIENGTYTLSMWIQRDTGTLFNDEYIFVSGYSAADSAATMKQETLTGASSSAYVEVKITNIVVTSGEATVGIYSDGQSDAWANIDDVTFTKN